MTPRRVYRECCRRGDLEDGIKELKHGLGLERTSCSSFVADRLRVQITTATHVLMQELARQARDFSVEGLLECALKTKVARPHTENGRLVSVVAGEGFEPPTSGL